jgi:predicted TIM-barrel fold metal-dependent hydrolase
MSVWTSVQTLGAFVYGADHRKVLRRRREWFQRMTGAYLACWWIPAGHRPSTAEAEAEERVRHLRRSRFAILPAARGHRREGSQRPSRLVVPRLTLSLSHSAATVISASSARWCSGSCSCRNAGSR